MALIPAETVTVMSEGLTVDLIVWRKFRRPMPGYVERVLDQNGMLPFLIDPLPLGTVFTLPAVEIVPKPTLLDVVTLWT